GSHENRQATERATAAALPAQAQAGLEASARVGRARGLAARRALDLGGVARTRQRTARGARLAEQRRRVRGGGAPGRARLDREPQTVRALSAPGAPVARLRSRLAPRERRAVA